MTIANYDFRSLYSHFDLQKKSLIGDLVITDTNILEGAPACLIRYYELDGRWEIFSNEETNMLNMRVCCLSDIISGKTDERSIMQNMTSNQKAIRKPNGHWIICDFTP